MPNDDRDVGLQLLNEVTKWAEARGVPIVAGYIESLPMTSVDLELAEDGDLGAQLIALLERTEPYLIVVERRNLTSERFDETLEKLGEREGAADKLAAARACRKFIGHVSSLHIWIFIKSGPVALEYVFLATWFDDAFSDDVDDDSAYEDAEKAARYRAEQAEREKWTPPMRSKVARQIASDLRFSQAKTEAARVLITRDVLGADTPSNEYLVKEISREAKAVFDLEIKPKKQR